MRHRFVLYGYHVILLGGPGIPTHCDTWPNSQYGFSCVTDNVVFIIFLGVGVGFTKEGRKRFWEAFKLPHIPFSMPMHVTLVKTQKSTHVKSSIF